jgi:hypothetical protein
LHTNPTGTVPRLRRDDADPMMLAALEFRRKIPIDFQADANLD